jgi:lipopolysaccharide export system permease protein
LGVAARYITRELLAVLIVTTLVLLLIGAGGRFIGYLQDAVAGKYAADTLLTIIQLRLPEFLQLILPFALFIAILLTLSRLHAESEMVILQTGGLSTLRLLVWVTGPALLMSGLVGWLAVDFSPRSNQRLGEFFLEQRARQDFQNVNPGVFNINSRETRVLYAESVSEDRTRLGTVFIWERLEDGREATTWAQTGTQRFDANTGSQFLVLEKGRRYEGTAGTAQYRVIEFNTLGQRISTDASGSNRVGISGVLTRDLPANGRGAAERHFRIALPVFTLVAAMIAVAMARVRPRASRFAQVLPGLMLLLLYYLAIMGNHYLLEEEQIPLEAGMWAVHAIMLVVLLILLRRVARPVR